MSGSTLTSLTAGDLVISVVGDDQNTGTLTLDQASPIYLQELTTSGSLVGTMVLPQTTMVVNGVTEYAVSGEYGSALSIGTPAIPAGTMCGTSSTTTISCGAHATPEPLGSSSARA